MHILLLSNRFKYLVLSSPSHNYNLARSFGYRRWHRNNLFLLCPIFGLSIWAVKVYPCPLLSSHLFFCLHLLHFAMTVPRRIGLAKPENLETCENLFSFLHQSQDLIFNGCLNFLRTSSLVMWLYEMFKNIRQHAISKACVLLPSRCMIRRHREIWRWQGGASVSALI